MTTELTNEQINLAIAKIAGWAEVELLNPQRDKRVFIGVNASHPELGAFIPDYSGSIDAITKVFDCLGLDWNIGKDCDAFSVVNDDDHPYAFGATPAIALCKLLLAINPDPIVPKVLVIEATFS
jgi:hypothetical protein